MHLLKHLPAIYLQISIQCGFLLLFFFLSCTQKNTARTQKREPIISNQVGVAISQQQSIWPFAHSLGTSNTTMRRENFNFS